MSRKTFNLKKEQDLYKILLLLLLIAYLVLASL